MTTTKLKLPELTASQSQKHVTHNEALFFLDNIVQLSVIDRNLATPPGSPVLGDTYLIDAAPTGSWAGKTNQIASYDGSGWIFFVPAEGWHAWVNDENISVCWDGAAWVNVTGVPTSAFNDGTFMLLGIGGAIADATNRLSVNADGVLFNQDGSGGFNLTLNKNATGDTLAVTMQTGFSTRALVGLLADNNFAIRVSADGTTFYDALTFAAGSGAATFNASVRTGNGSAATPAWSFGSDTDNGFYRIGANSIGLSVGGTLRLTCATTSFTFASSVTALSATAANISALYLGLGGATADATNRLSVNTPAVLLNNAGAGIDMTFNKNAAGDDASMSFKTGFTTYALIGLLADNDFSIKIGTGFLTALKISNTTGEATFNYPVTLDGQATLPAAPGAGKLKVYASTRAGTQWLDVQRSSGRDFPLQPHLGTNRLGWWSPATGSTINNNGLPRSTIGSVSTPGITSTNLSESMRRWRVTSAATAAAVAEERATANVCWRGNAAGLGGFTYINRLSMTTLQVDSTGFFGLYGSISALSTTLTVADMVDCVGLGFTLGTHANWQIVHNNGSGAPTTIDLGASFPIDNTTNVYTLTIVAAPNGSDIVVRVVEETSGTVHESVLSSDIPAPATFLSVRNYLNNGATAAAVAYDCTSVYIETDY